MRKIFARTSTWAALIASGVLATIAIAADPQPPKPNPSANPPAANKDKEAPKNAPSPVPSKPADEAKPAPKDANPPQPAPAPKDANPEQGAPAQTAPQPPQKSAPEQADRSAQDRDRRDRDAKDNDRPNAQPDRDRNSAADRARDQYDRDNPRDNRANRQDDRDNRQDAQRDRRSDANRHEVNRPVARDAQGAGAQARRSTRNTANIGIDFRTGSNNSLLINSVGPSGYFGSVGFRPGDQIVSAGGQRFNNQAAFYSWLGTVAVGQRVPIILMRNGQQQTVYWTPTEEFIREYRTVASDDAHGPLLGIMLDDQVQNAAVVMDVQPNSPAHRAGIRANDTIVGVNDQDVQSPEDFYAAVDRAPAGSDINMDVSRVMRVRVAENANPAPAQQQTLAPEQGAPARVAQPPAAPPAPVRQAPNPAQPRRGILRNR